MWERYRAPIAVTEVHHGCTHDEQLRWLIEVWDAAGRLAREGVEVLLRPLTVWLSERGRRDYLAFTVVCLSVTVYAGG